MVVANVLPANSFYCFTAFVSFYIQSYSGALLTLIIATVRFILTKKSARNVLVRNKTVLIWSLSAYSGLIVLFFGYASINQVLDQPFALYIEACLTSVRPPRVIPKPIILILQMPNVFNVVSLVVDLSLLKFLKSVVRTVNTLNIDQSVVLNDDNNDEVFRSKPGLKNC